MKAVVTGAGGFLGHHLICRLKADGHWVRGVDVKRPEFGESAADEFVLADLRELGNCLAATDAMDDVYHLAADMGGIGYITTHQAHLVRNNVLMDSHMLEAARVSGAARFYYSSSACVYPQSLQTEAEVTPLRESDVMPADPDQGYGWEKLFAERLVCGYRDEFDLDTRIARLHNIYGPLGAYDGGREKAPAALCRKAAFAADGGAIEVWGSGSQTRSFCYVDDCIEGIVRIMESGFNRPVNLGTEELVTVDELAEAVIAASGKRLALCHDMTKPQGVAGRNSDNSLLRKVTGWEPKVPLQQGIDLTYRWISDRIRQAV